MTNKPQAIPFHQLYQRSDTGIELRYLDGTAATNNVRTRVAHRDDHYLFALTEDGICTLMVDFREVRLEGGSAFYILPGQVHYYVPGNFMKGWLLSVDPVLINSTFRSIFEERLFTTAPVNVNQEMLTKVLQSLQYQLSLPPSALQQSITHMLTDAFAGMVAESYVTNDQKSPLTNSRSEIIARQFRQLLTKQFKNIKGPAQYADLLNYSLAHLNDSVKRVTGFPVSYWIQHELVLEAKRLLYYSDLNIKQIAWNLGYEDHAYFSRLFTKVAGLSPAAFRNKIRE